MSRLGLILLPVILVAGGASVFSLLQDEKYTASASLVPQQPAAPNFERASKDIIARRTTRRLAESGEIAAQTAVSSVEVTRRGGSIRVEATARRPRIAARVANAFADEYAAFRNDSGRAIGGVTVVARATLPTSPSSTKPLRTTAIGALAGLLLGLGFALALGRFDRLRDPKDLEEAFGLPVLTRLPESEAMRKGSGVVHDLPAPEAEAFRKLRANLRRAESDNEVDSVLITSAAVEDGKSTVAFNLAAAAAAAGIKVLLIEADVRRPILAHSLGLPRDQGLTSLLAGEESRLADVSFEVLLAHNTNGSGSLPTMDVILAGEISHDASDLISSEEMRHVIRAARRKYTLVVIDSPPAGFVSEPAVLMSEVSAVVIVGRVGELTGEEADRLREQLEQIDAPTVGVVANFAAA